MRKKIGELLIEAGVVTEEQVRQALGRQRAYGKGERLGRVLVSMGLVAPTSVARALATQFDMPFVELPEIPPEVTALIPLEFQAEHHIVPFRLEGEGRGERLHIAVEDPADMAVLDELRFQLRKTLRVHVAASDDIDNALALASGEKLEVVEAIAIEDEPGVDIDIEHGTSTSTVAGGRFEPAQKPPAAPTPSAPPASSPLDWDLPEPPPAPPPPALSGASTQVGVDFIDALLGLAPARPPPPPEQEPTGPRVPVVVFGGAAKGSQPEPLTPPPDFSEADLQVLDNLERLSKGEETTLDSEKVKPARMVAALIRLLIRKGVIQETEFLEELSRK